MKKGNLRITWGVLLLGLEQDWLTPSEVIELVNKHSKKLTIDEGLLVHLNVNEDDKSIILEWLREKGESEKEEAINYWYYNELLSIEQSDKPIRDKLKDIELQWSKFDYPNEWREFIYYLPNEKSSSKEDIYQLFLNYLDSFRD